MHSTRERIEGGGVQLRGFGVKLLSFTVRKKMVSKATKQDFFNHIHFSIANIVERFIYLFILLEFKIQFSVIPSVLKLCKHDSYILE